MCVSVANPKSEYEAFESRVSIRVRIPGTVTVRVRDTDRVR